MSPDEWLGIVAWTSQRVRRGWTVDQAARIGLALKGYEPEAVKAALDRLIRRDKPLDLRSIKTELHRKPSKFASILEKRHVELFPNGCESRWCEICLDRHRSNV